MTLATSVANANSTMLPRWFVIVGEVADHWKGKCMTANCQTSQMRDQWMGKRMSTN